MPPSAEPDRRLGQRRLESARIVEHRPPDRDEIELKLPCQNLDAIRQKLREQGASPVSPLHFESNDLYDDGEGRHPDGVAEEQADGDRDHEREAGPHRR